MESKNHPVKFYDRYWDEEGRNNPKVIEWIRRFDEGMEKYHRREIKRLLKGRNPDEMTDFEILSIKGIGKVRYEIIRGLHKLTPEQRQERVRQAVEILGQTFRYV